MASAAQRAHELLSLARQAVANDQDDEGPLPVPLPRAVLPKQPESQALEVVTCAPKHFSSASYDQLQSVSLTELHFGVNTGKAVVLVAAQEQDCKPITSRHSSLRLVVEDSQGATALLSVYTCTGRIIDEQPYFAIKEPRIRKGRDGSIVIRVDSPTDVVALPPDSQRSKKETAPFRARLARFQKEPKRSSLEWAKAAAKAYFAKRQHSKALRCWTIALHEEPSAIDRALLLLNRAAVYILPGAARWHAARTDLLAIKSALDLLSPQQQDKYWHRYHKAESQICDDMSYDQLARQHLGDTAHAAMHARLAMWSGERDRGEYDWPVIWQAARDGQQEGVHAEWEGAFEWRDIPGRGRGLVAKSDMSAGTLVMTARPLVTAPAQSAAQPPSLAVNIVTEEILPSSHDSLRAKIFDRIADDPSLAVALQRLYAGPNFQQPSAGELPSSHCHGFDAGRIEGIDAFNTFGIRSCANKDVNDGQISLPSGLYHTPSLLNHSCLANCSYTFFGDLFSCRTVRDVKAGEELTISYCDPLANLADRRERLARHFGKARVCRCQLCELEAQGDYKQRRALMQTWSSVSTASIQPREIYGVLGKVMSSYSVEQKGAIRPELHRLWRIKAGIETANRAMNTILCEEHALMALGHKRWERTPVTGNEVIACDSAVLSWLSLGQARCAEEVEGHWNAVGDIEPISVIRTKVQQLHSALYAPGLLKMMLGSWMEQEKITWYDLL